MRGIQIFQETGNAEVFRWFCSDSWYDESANFVISNRGKASIFGVTDEAVIQAFGEPARIIDVDEWNIYVYEKDLSLMIK